MVKDLAKQKDYFNMKIEMRQSVYKEQIQQLVSSFNRNYELNMKMMQDLISQKYQYEEELRDIKQSHDDYVRNQTQSYEQLIDNM